MNRQVADRDAIELLRELSEAFGVSGFEEEVRERIRDRVAPWVDELHVDPLGNLHGVLNPDRPLTLMLDAHMDEVGFVVRSLEDSGFLRLAPIGGWDLRILPGQTVFVRGQGGKAHWGVIGTIPPHVLGGEEKERVVGWKDLFVDVGAGSAAELGAMGIRVGSPALLPQKFRQLAGDVLFGKALDDRAGCVVLIRLLERLFVNRPEVRVVATFSCGEEVGSRGAQVAARHWRPQMAMVIEGTLATDSPGVRPDQQVSSLGRGPVVTTVDRSLIVREPVIEWIIRTAESREIPWQMKTPMVGSTDGGAIQLSADGVLTWVVAVPCRYIHSPGCLVRLEDLTNTQSLVEALVHDAPRIYREILGG
jgi:tetrahedral aminopeptidase